MDMDKVLAVAVCLLGAVTAEPTVKRNTPQYGHTYTPNRNNPYRPMPQYGGRDFDSYPPSSYQYKYDVTAPEYGTQFGHQEARQGDVVQGRYYVLLPDGRTQVVDYVADQHGYRPKVSYEGSGGRGSGGFNRHGGHSGGESNILGRYPSGASYGGGYPSGASNGVGYPSGASYGGGYPSGGSIGVGRYPVGGSYNQGGYLSGGSNGLGQNPSGGSYDQGGYYSGGPNVQGGYPSGGPNSYLEGHHTGGALARPYYSH